MKTFLRLAGQFFQQIVNVSLFLLLFTTNGYSQVCGAIDTVRVTAITSATICQDSSIAAVLSTTAQAGASYQWIKDPKWSYGGNADFSAGTANYTTIAVDSLGTPYIFYSDATISDQAIVKKLVGANWVTVGSAGFSVGPIYSTAIAFDHSDTLYVAYQDGSNGSRATVMKFNGTAWVPVGATGFSPGGISNGISLTFDSQGFPVVAFADYFDGSNRASVMKFDGANWNYVGSPRFSEAGVYSVSLALDNNDVPYVGFSDGAINYKATVMNYNGAIWDTVGARGFSQADISFISLARNSNGEIYAAYNNNANNGRANVKKFDGTGWVSIGPVDFSPLNCSYISLAIDGSDSPYIAYQDAGYGQRASVRRFNGTSWADVGNPAFSPWLVYYTSMVLDRFGTPYVVYQDFGNSNKASVKIFDGTHVGLDGNTYIATDTACYAVKVKTCNGGYSMNTVCIDMLSPSASVVSETPASCIGCVDGSATVMGSGGLGTTYTYSWNTSPVQTGPTAMGLSAGTYVCTVTDSNMCPVAQTVTIIEPALNTCNGVDPVTVSALTSATICQDSAISVTLGTTAQAGASYQWIKNPKWKNSGLADFSAGNADYTAIAVDTSGTPYVVYSDASQSDKATVKKFNGTSWVTVGTAGFSAGGAYYTSIAIDSTNTPYVAYYDGGSGGATVMKFNGSNWVTVGNAGFTPGGISFNTSIAFNSHGVPYVAFSDYYDGMNKASVMKFNGSNWVYVGDPRFTEGATYSVSLAIDYNDVPYVGFSDDAIGNKATVMKFNGTVWDTLGVRGFSQADISFISIAKNNNGEIYAAYSNLANNSRANVKKFDGTDWVSIGAPDFSPLSCDYLSLAVDGSGSPYVAFQDGGYGQKASVRRFDGTSWVSVGTPGFSAGLVYYTSIALDRFGTPYVAYQDYINSHKASVKIFDGIHVGTNSNSYIATDTSCYLVQVRTCKGSSSTNTVCIDMMSPVVSVVSETPASCIGCSDGSATVLGSGGLGTTYTYSWNTSPVQTSVTATGLTAGTYVCTVTDSNMCPAIQWVTIIEPALNACNGVTPVTLNALTSATVCQDSAISVTLGTTAQAGAFYQWIKNPSWSYEGAANFSAGNADYTAIAVDTNGTPYVVYSDASVSDKATVKKFNGTNWVTVGVAGFSAGAAYYTAIAIDSANTPYVAYEDGGSGGATVMKLVGSSWVPVGTPGFTPGGISYNISLAFNSHGVPYVAFSDYYDGSNRASVMKFDGSNWVFVGDPRFTEGATYSVSLAIDYNDIPYVGFSDDAIGSKATVMKFNGTIWDTLGVRGFSQADISFISIARNNSGEIYAAYNNNANNGRANVKKFNGTSWVSIGAPDFSPLNCSYMSLAIDGSGSPFVAYQDAGYGQKASVRRFDGTSWVDIGTPALSPWLVYYTSMALDRFGTPYVVYQDFGNSGKASVKKFDGTHVGSDGNTFIATDTACYMVKVKTCRGAYSTNEICVSMSSPTASLFAETNVSCNGGSDGTATVYATGGTGSLNYSWNTTPAQTAATATGLAPGSYTCTVTDNNMCPASQMATISQPAPINTTVTITGYTLLAVYSLGTSYQWIDCNNDGAEIPGATYRSYLPTTDGTYAVVITTGVCVDTSACKTVVGLGVSDAQRMRNKFSIYPNPNNGTFNVQADHEGIYDLVNVLGEVVQTLHFSVGTNNTITINDMAGGFYFIQARDREMIVRQKIVVVK